VTGNLRCGIPLQGSEKWLWILHEISGRQRLDDLMPLLRSASLTAAAIAAAGTALAAAPSESALTCTNPASGTTWQIKVDFAAKTVDANVADISDAKISWHDPKDGGNYTLDRKSGSLTFVAPSSTGGYMIFDRCNLENSG
jgi:hypothetical protein